jgi:monoamine oxidase
METKMIIAIIAALLAFIGNVPYLVDVMRGRVKPHPYTWFVWTIVSCVVFFGQLAKGAGVGAIPTAASEIFTVIIFLFSLRYGFKNITRTDTVLLIIAILGIIPWILTKDPTVSVIVAVSIDLVGFLPTLRKTWYHPETEAPLLYSMNVLRHILMLWSLQAYNIATTLHSIVMITTNLAMVLIIMPIKKNKELCKKILGTLFFIIGIGSIYLCIYKTINQKNIMNNNKKVIIVGAGISGLSAAKNLHNKGFDVTILEAKDYVGGRIKTETVQGEKFELGASWIHGDKNNPVADILKQEGKELTPTSWETSVIYKNGKKIELDNEDRLSGFYSILENEKEKGEKDISLQEVWNKFVQKNKDKYSQDELRDLYHLLVFNINTEVGTDIKNISTWEYEEEEEMKGGDKIVLGGYDAVINHLAKDLNIRLATIVTKVEDTGNSVKVYTKNNEVYEADQVIVTVPLGVLQKGSIVFTPELPEYKKIAINSLKMGNLHKTFLTFESKFWDDVDTISILNGDDTKWGDFINLELVLHKPVLLALHAGDNATSLENNNDAEVGEAAFKALQSVYLQAQKPKLVVTSNWYADPFTLGSYSYVPVGAKLSMYDDIAKPFGRIHFAGEHTISQYPSTTHGAYLSGVRVAGEMVK